MVTVFRVEAIDDRIAEAVRRLVPQLSAALPLPSREALARMAASPSAALFCSETGGEVAGMLSLAWYDVPSGRCAWIEDVVVDAAARGRGAGRALVEAALERCGVLSCFGRIFTCGEVGHGKNEPHIFEAALRFLGTGREETLVFDDALYAVRTAKKAGFPVAAVYDSHEKGRDEVRALADVYLENLAQLDKLRELLPA